MPGSRRPPPLPPASAVSETASWDDWMAAIERPFEVIDRLRGRVAQLEATARAQEARISELESLIEL